MENRSDFDRVQKGEIVLLFFAKGDDRSAVVAQRWAFEALDDRGAPNGVKTEGWRETWAGARIDLKPYAYAKINPPDPDDIAGGGY